jgi:hypothetical protein
MKITREDVVYIAGFVDGEGYIGIKKHIRDKTKNWSPMYSEKVEVAGIDKKSILFLNKFVKGYIYSHKASKLSKRGYWSWSVSENKARTFLELIKPYLRIKNKEADIVLKLSVNKRTTRSRKISDFDVKYREGLYWKIKNLHGHKK